MHQEIPITPRSSEPTLASLAAHLARTVIPYELWTLMQVALPIALDLALRGWWRGAAWALAVAAFGAWGLADHWLDRASSTRRKRLARAVRGVAGVLAVAPPVLLLLELFLRLLGSAPIS